MWRLRVSLLFPQASAGLCRIIREPLPLIGPSTSSPYSQHPPGSQQGGAGGFSPAPPPFAESAYPWPDQPVEPRLRRWRYVLNLLAVFVVGTGAGLAAAWWATKPAPQPQLQTPPAAAAPVAPAREQDAVALPGLPAGELPYDGVAVDGDEALVPRLPYRIESLPETSGAGGDEPGTGVTRKPVPEAASDKASPTKERGSDTRTSDAKTSDAKAASDKPEARKESKTANRRTRAATGEDKATRDRAARDRAARDKAASEKAANESASRASAQRARQDAEIERIRQQAVDELWRKRVRERMPDQGRAGDPSPVAQAKVMSTAQKVRRRLAECDEASSLIRRERCRWKICGGRWGEDGCPGYRAQPNAEYY